VLLSKLHRVRAIEKYDTEREKKKKKREGDGEEIPLAGGRSRFGDATLCSAGIALIVRF
jgi:hypothetical protein